MTCPLLPRYAVTHVAAAVAAASDALAQSAAARMSGELPWLVLKLKHNGGQTYDMDVCQWGWYAGYAGEAREDWVRKLGDIVRVATAMGVWGDRTSLSGRVL
jgi:hypothetical protein